MGYNDGMQTIGLTNLRYRDHKTESRMKILFALAVLYLSMVDASQSPSLKN